MNCPKAILKQQLIISRTPKVYVILRLVCGPSIDLITVSVAILAGRQNGSKY